MRVAVITPYYKEDFQTLWRCHRSVLKQSHQNHLHFLVADGHPKSYVDNWNGEHLKLPNCGDYGDTPRAVAAAVAAAQNYDAVAFLDADCWWEPSHLTKAIGVLEATGSDVVTMPRRLYTPEGKYLQVDKESDGESFNDTNCFLIHKNAFFYISAWMWKLKHLSKIGDRIFWQALKQHGVRIARQPVATVNYTTNIAFHYQQAGLTPPDSARVIVNKNGTYEDMTWGEYEKR
jgi:glycosyltransferase involved in cell wall biosynthesis